MSLKLNRPLIRSLSHSCLLIRRYSTATKSSYHHKPNQFCTTLSFSLSQTCFPTSLFKPLYRRFSTTFPSNESSILVLAEHNNQTLHDSTLSVLSACHKLSKKPQITLLITGYNCFPVAEQASKLPLHSVVLIDHPALEHHLAEHVSDALMNYYEKHPFTYIVGAATANGKNILPRIGALLDVQPVTDIIEIKDPNTFKRPIYAGNAIQTVETSDKIKVLSLRATNFEKIPFSDRKISITKYDFEPKNHNIEWLKDQLSITSRPSLSSADVIIAGGRGLKSSDGFAMIEKLADCFPKAAIGASRAAVDAGYIGNDYQIGQTGKVVAPKLYVAVGISGAIQHLAGMKDSKCIVAINKDLEAPIFQIADYGIVGDLFKIVPEMTEKLKKGN